MEDKIMYRINYEKAIETLVWLAEKKPSIDIYHIAKVLYYAEKTHLNKYARPIIGDTYIRMPYGQAPSGVKDLIIKNSWLDPNHIQGLSQGVTVNKTPYSNITAKRKPNLDFFSDTDIECLEDSLSKYGDLPFEKLKKTSHAEKSWLDTGDNQPIDYSLMIDDDNPNKKEILEEMYSNAVYARF